MEDSETEHLYVESEDGILSAEQKDGGMEIPVKKTKRIPDIPSVNGTNLQENGIYK